MPAQACVGAVVGPDEPSYILWGPHLGRHVTFLPAASAVEAAAARALPYVVVSVGSAPSAAGALAGAGWTLEPLGTYWLLAVAPAGRGAGC